MPATLFAPLPPAAGDAKTSAAPTATAGDPWTTVMPAILARIKAPVFPDHEYPITRYGAPTDGKGDASDAIRAAIDACHRDGGGRVLVPAGTFLTGPIHLKSNVNLHLDEGATLLFHTDPQRYMPVVFTRWEGVELMNFSPLIYAYEQENIAITGKGTLDGQAGYDNWWGWVKLDENTKPKIPLARASRNKLMAEADRPIAGMDVSKRVYGLGEYIRPPFIQPYRCKNILIEDVTILRSPFWEINPVLSQNITVRGVTIRSHGANNDGCDPESSRDILIENCSFDTGDDCIAIKSGRNNDGRRVAVPSENIIIRNCDFKDGHGGVTIGSEISGDCRNVFAENCRMDSPNLDQALRFKTNAVRGGVIENIFFRNIQVGRVGKAVVHVDFKYEEGDKGDYMPVLRNVLIEKVTSKSSPHAIYLRGFAQAPIRDITIRDCTFEGVEKDDFLEHVENITKTNVRVVRK
ncbi:glycoside hydrolase [Termitidicoccus mucosus]|uniref:Glycoside hydrolase n=1 Tax=Termitidicoccus mucosus TaxID=1184151 RepID=A0A178IN73_9BACT|nr:glycoside hydrolase [Opitutaceae bacterium TSB47]